MSTARPVPNSFLNYAVESTGQLVKEVQNDPAVRDRYMRHFGMNSSQLTSYLWTLRPSTLSEAQTVTVYSVPGSGAIKVHAQKLTKGEKVFIDADDKPALLAKCGNPLGQGPVSKTNIAFVMPMAEDTPVLALQDLPVPDTTPVLMLDSRPSIAMVNPPDTIADVIDEPATTITTTTTTPVPTPTPPTVTTPPVVSSGGDRNAFGLLPLLGAGALVGILGSHHGTPPVVPPAPEPVGVLIFGASAAALLIRKHRRQ